MVQSMKYSWPEHDREFQSKNFEYECNFTIVEACFKPFLMATCFREANFVHALRTHTSMTALSLHLPSPSSSSSFLIYHLKSSLSCITRVASSFSAMPWPSPMPYHCHKRRQGRRKEWLQILPLSEMAQRVGTYSP